jgi:hypothetical protein
VRESGDVVRTSRRFDIHCETLSGQQWELAVERLRTHRYFNALVGDLGIYRYDNRPRWDIRSPLVIEVDVSSWWRGEPQLELSVKNELAANDVTDALNDVDRLRASSVRFDNLIDSLGFLIHLVYDYSDGAVLLARAEPPEFAVRWAHPRQTLL